MPHQPRLPRQPVSAAKRRMQVQFPLDDFEALRALAQEHHHSINAEVVRAIREHLEHVASLTGHIGVDGASQDSQRRHEAHDNEGTESQ